MKVLIGVWDVRYLPREYEKKLREQGAELREDADGFVHIYQERNAEERPLGKAANP